MKKIITFAVGVIIGVAVGQRLRVQFHRLAVPQDTCPATEPEPPAEHQALIDMIGREAYDQGIRMFGTPPAEVIAAANTVAGADAAQIVAGIPGLANLLGSNAQQFLDDIRADLVANGPQFTEEFAKQAREHRCPAHPNGLPVDDLLPEGFDLKTHTEEPAEPDMHLNDPNDDLTDMDDYDPAEGREHS